MSVAHAILFGMFILILAYLTLTNAKSVASIFGDTRNLLVGDTLALQGR